MKMTGTLKRLDVTVKDLVTGYRTVETVYLIGTAEAIADHLWTKYNEDGKAISKVQQTDMDEVTVL